MKKLQILSAIVCAAASAAAFAAPVTVDSTGILDPNPSNLNIIDAGNTSLAAARVLVQSAYLANLGGVIDFQQQFQGGTFPNAPSSNNGVDVATDPANPLQVTTSSSAGIATGPVIFSFYRSDVVTADGGTPASVTNIDSNTNQGINTISGGYKSRYPGAVSPTNPSGDGTSVLGTVDFTTVPPTVDPATGGSAGTGGAYMGITNTGVPANFVFNTGLRFFGITALPRGATRDTAITLTLSDNSTVSAGAAQVGTSAVFYSYLLSEAQLASGLSIVKATFTSPGTLAAGSQSGVNRYDDLAFVVVPEPSMLGALAPVALLLTRRRRA